MLPKDLVGVIDQLSGFAQYKKDITAKWHTMFNMMLKLYLHANPKARRRKHYAISMLFTLIVFGSSLEDKTVTKRIIEYLWLAPSPGELFR